MGRNRIKKLKVCFLVLLNLFLHLLFFEIFKSMKTILLTAFIAFSIQLQAKEAGNWWFTKKAKKNAIKVAKKSGLSDTILETSTARMFLYRTKKYDPTKPTLILIHGMGINGTTQWKEQIPYFSKKFNIIVPDLVGYDKSEQKTNDFSPENQAQNIFEAAMKLKMGNKFHIMGFSYGGLVVANFHKMFPEHVLKTVIADAPVKYFSPSIADSIITSRNLVHFERVISPQTPREVDQFFDALLSGKKKKLPKFLKKKLCKHFFALNATVKRQQMDHLKQNPQKYQEIDYHLNSENVFFLWGTLDGAIPYIIGERLHFANPKAFWHPIVGAKHDATMNFAEEFNTNVMKFFGF
jgi:pimeloyl-ACP methyl ester carboxylesterase